MAESSAKITQNGAPETYKRLITACGLLGGLALGIGTALSRPFIGVGLYAVGLIAAASIPYATGVTLFDERDDALHQRASGFTLALFGWLSALVYPSLVVLWGTGHFSWGPATAAIAVTTAIVYMVYGVAFGYYQYR